MSRPFTKMHGLGNDFVVMTHQTLSSPEAATIARWSSRRRGIGFDQLLLLDPETDPPRYRVFNADGSEVEQCGNGVRCLARWLLDRGFSPGPAVTLLGAAGPITAEGLADGRVRVDMGRPRLEPEQVPVTLTPDQHGYQLEIDGETHHFAALSMGNPHAVLIVDDVAAAPVAALGPALQRHPAFPQGVNVGFLEVRSRQHVALRVFERGAGETQACGSGACAAVVAGHLWDLLERCVRVTLPGGDLEIQWDGGDKPVWMTGPAEYAFEGELDL